ncbi:beta-N-acetylglucosaminidase [Aspergillus heteromorphus CBS 117.55]|uniref:Beta-N-acetylglucosaminidase n=1 Tax=Aspergillus heteromorphus CBS 117.55 TaxID=1448321 RepID=A0A317X1D3_9EURO|nr:beta-N-acetylglucosaminidase [Aspergillus heteromorphus CBS 117.55]PWY92363.1 beta-N-acetylglucosaminidase [Aspergillus heteromorphus CBS 117.55]
MSSADLKKKIGQLFAVGFHGLTPSPEIKTLIREYGLGGIVLFKRNISDEAQLQSLTLALQEEARSAGHEHPLFIGIDQENGLVTRIAPPVAPQLPGPMALGATNSPELAYKVGVATGEILSSAGINMDYAPVCDINSEPLNPVIGVRSFGDDPEFVGRFASATARGLRKHKVVPTVKHFPGHGDTAVDSHYGLPVIPKTRDQLEQCELVPFRRAAAEGIEAVMTAHISLPEIGDGKLPATLSPDVMKILREDMGYNGMVVTDCLEMDGIRATYGTEQGSVLALAAGCDSIMICHTYAVQVASIVRVCEAVESGEVPLSRLEEAYLRVTQLKSSFLNWDTSLRLREDRSGPNRNLFIHSKLADQAYARSATLVRDQSQILPVSSTSNVVFLFPGDKTPAGGAVDGEGLGRKGSYNASVYLDILKKYNPTAVEIRYGEAALSAEQLNAIEAADVVIFTSINARESQYQRTLGLEMPRRARALVSIAACNPYDFLDDASIGTYIATYEPTLEAFAAAAEVIFGASTAKGTLPVGNQTKRLSIEKSALTDPKDMSQLAAVWNAALPTYSLPAENLQKLVAQPNGHHFIARIGDDVAGFCLTYTSNGRFFMSGNIAALAVDPARQGQGVGTTLLGEVTTWYKVNLKLPRLELSSVFPRFWPGIPEDLPSGVQEFFEKRGFSLLDRSPRNVDLYRDIKDFKSTDQYTARAEGLGYTFAPLQPEHYEECLIGQRKNFSDNQAWMAQYEELDPNKYPSSIMVVFDSQGKQVGWTLMLDPSSPSLQKGWALPPLCGPQTGLIGCVGVDMDHRKKGVGLALLSHAMENMRQRGIEGVFVDWVVVEGFYEQLGFEVWREYRQASLLDM